MLIKVKTSIQLILELISDSMKMGHQHLFKWALAPAITVVGRRSQDVFIFKIGFRMSFHFQNVVLFRNVRSFSICENGVKGFVRFFFHLSEKTIVKKSL